MAAVPRVTFTANLRRLVDCPPADVPGATVGEALEAVFARAPQLRSYIVDDQGALRRHVVVFVGGELVRDRVRLTDAVTPGAEIAVMQALSGG
jgi:molybdopterin synthase sulfur carrier subunit